MQRNDILWKGALEDLFDDFLRFFYSDADEFFDLERGFVYLDKELEQLFPPDEDNFAPRYVDKLVKVFTRGGTEEWILVHVEVQGYSDQDFAKRMHQYYYRILDQYDKPITAFSIFADTNKNFQPKYYERDFLGTRLYYSFNTYKIIEQDEAKLEASNNPFAMVVLSAKLALTKSNASDQVLFDMAFDLAKRLLSKQIPRKKIRNVMTFLRYYVRFDNHEMFTKFEKAIAVLTERSTTMGIEELLINQSEKKGLKKGLEKGLEKGMEKGMEKGILLGTKKTALEMKKRGMDINLIADVTGLSIEEIEAL